MVLRGLRVTLNCGPMMPRAASLWDTRCKFCLSARDEALVVVLVQQWRTRRGTNTTRKLPHHLRI